MPSRLMKYTNKIIQKKRHQKDILYSYILT